MLEKVRGSLASTPIAGSPGTRVPTPEQPADGAPEPDAEALRTRAASQGPTLKASEGRVAQRQRGNSVALMCAPAGVTAGPTMGAERFDLKEWLGVLADIDPAATHASIRSIHDAFTGRLGPELAHLAFDPGIAWRWERFLEFAAPRLPASAHRLWSDFAGTLGNREYVRVVALTKEEATAIERAGMMSSSLRAGSSVRDAVAELCAIGLEAAISRHANQTLGPSRATSHLISVGTSEHVGGMATRIYADQDVPRSLHVYELRMPALRTLRSSDTESFVPYGAYPSEIELRNVDHSSDWRFGGGGEFNHGIEMMRSLEAMAHMFSATDPRPRYEALRQYDTTWRVSFYARRADGSRVYFSGKVVGFDREMKHVHLRGEDGQLRSAPLGEIDLDELWARQATPRAPFATQLEAALADKKWMTLAIDCSEPGTAIVGRPLELVTERGWPTVVLKTGATTVRRVRLDDIIDARPGEPPVDDAAEIRDARDLATALIRDGCVVQLAQASGKASALSRDADGEWILRLDARQGPIDVPLRGVDLCALRAALPASLYPAKPDASFLELVDPARLDLRDLPDGRSPDGCTAFVDVEEKRADGAVLNTTSVGRLLQSRSGVLLLLNEETGRVALLGANGRDARVKSAKVQAGGFAMRSTLLFGADKPAKFLEEHPGVSAVVRYEIDGALAWAGGRLLATAEGGLAVEAHGVEHAIDLTAGWCELYWSTDPRALAAFSTVSSAPDA